MFKVTYRARNAEIRKLREAGIRVAEIASKFGLSPCRVSQLIHEPEEPSKWPRAYFARVMKHWLWGAGYRRCGCGVWASEVTPTSRRCKDCNRKMIKEYRATPEGRQKQREWQRNNPDRVRAMQIRWLKKRVGAGA